MIPVPRLLVRYKAPLALISVWIFLFLYFFRLRPIQATKQCSWQIPSNYQSQGKKEPQVETESDMQVSDPHKVLVIADPQLIDNHTYPGRNPLLLSLSKHVVDSYLYNNYNALINELEPDTVLFLGDLLDNGRESMDDYYNREVVRFRRIFRPFGSVKEFYLHVPGNHDIGWANGVTEYSLSRFTNTFASPNVKITKNNHDLIFFDSISYSNTEDPEVYQNSHDFLDTLAKETESKETRNTRLMFHHVPLYRQSDVNCGVDRESKTFPVSKGYQYQTVIDKDLSEKILDSINPDAIFSGDDHDYCEMFHNDKIPEITVKSISMAMGIYKPAVELLTLFDHPLDSKPILNHEGGTVIEKPTFQYSICYLPRPYVDSIVYGMFAGVHFLILFVLNVYNKNNHYRQRQRRQMKKFNRGNISSLLNNYITLQASQEGESVENDNETAIPLTRMQSPHDNSGTVNATTFNTDTNHNINTNSNTIGNAQTHNNTNILERMSIRSLLMQVVVHFVLVMSVYVIFNSF